MESKNRLHTGSRGEGGDGGCYLLFQLSSGLKEGGIIML